MVRSPARRGVGELNDDDFTPGRYDVYVLSDLPADFLSPAQQALLARSVRNGGGLIMLGGRSSFGMGGWAGTEVAQQILPVTVSPRDGQLEPEAGRHGSFLRNALGMSTCCKLAPTRSRRMAALGAARGDVEDQPSGRAQAQRHGFRPGRWAAAGADHGWCRGGIGPFPGLRRRDVGLGAFVRGREPHDVSKVLETGDFLARPQRKTRARTRSSSSSNRAGSHRDKSSISA